MQDLGCFCSDAAFNKAVSACTVADCTKIDQLYGLNITKTVCGAQVRSDTARAASVNWLFCAIAVTAVIMRLLGRLPRFGGRLSWDDFTMMLCGVSNMHFK